MRRVSFRAAGYDCFVGVCPHDPKCGPGTGGRHGQEWHYVIRNDADYGISAMALRVYTGIFPEGSRYQKTPPDGVDAADLSYHAGYPYEDENGEIHEPREADRGCAYLDGDRCSELTSACLPAKEVWDTYADPSTFEQPERFWLELERRFAEMDVEFRKQLRTGQEYVDRLRDDARCRAWLAHMEARSRSVRVLDGGVTEDDLYRWLKRATRRKT